MINATARAEKMTGLYHKPEVMRDLALTCAYCMKMCRFACPVAELTKSEMLTPWGKVSAIDQHLPEEKPEWHATVFECVHCNLCTEHCKHENPVEALLTRQRMQVPDDSLSDAMRAARSRLRDRYTGANFPAFAPPPAGQGKVLFWSALSLDQVHGRNAYQPLRPVAGKPGKLEKIIGGVLRSSVIDTLSGMDCGFDLYSAGLENEFLEHQRRITGQLPQYSLVICESALDCWTLNDILPRFGLSAGAPVVSLYSWLARHLGARLAAPNANEEWILWADGFTARALPEGFAAVESLARGLFSRPATFLPPEDAKRPPIWSEGFYRHHDENGARAMAQLAVDLLTDYKGAIVFTARREMEYFRSFGRGQRAHYLPDLLLRALGE